MFDFSLQVVLVTGGSGNLGGAVVQAFYAAGANLVVPDRAADRLPKLFPGLTTEKHYLAGATDVTNADDMARLVEDTLRRFGKIDVLVNTVGGYQAGKPVHETTLETWDALHNLNARTIFVTSRAVLPAMLEKGYGKIIHTAAKSALEGYANEAAYSAAKSAVARLTESMAAEYKKHGIRVNSILPAVLDTLKNREAFPNADFSTWVTPEAAAQVILFLASAQADVVNGALIPVG